MSLKDAGKKLGLYENWTVRGAAFSRPVDTLSDGPPDQVTASRVTGDLGRRRASTVLGPPAGCAAADRRGRDGRNRDGRAPPCREVRGRLGGRAGQAVGRAPPMKPFQR
ncbi:MAG: hypothetical protein JWP40_1360 [Blastococcus sp.]|nr:hypothetical protein [Blastococcus sp.]